MQKPQKTEEVDEEQLLRGGGRELLGSGCSALRGPHKRPPRSQLQNPGGGRHAQKRSSAVQS